MSLLNIIMHTRFAKRRQDVAVRELHLHPKDYDQLARDVGSARRMYHAVDSRRGSVATIDGVDLFQSQWLEPGTFVLLPDTTFVDWRCKEHDDCKAHPELGRECALRTTSATQGKP